MPAPAIKALMIRLPAGAAPGLRGAAPLRARGITFELEPMFRIGRGGGLGLEAGGWEWHRMRPTTALAGEHAWSLAHQALAEAPGVARAPGVFIEPDLEQEWVCESPRSGGGGPLGLINQAFDEQSPDYPGVQGRFAWHLGDEYSQLASARAQAGAPAVERIRIAHLDTGYDPGHQTVPAHLAHARNFVEGQAIDDAHDPFKRGLLKNPGHGTGTLGLLAGARFAFSHEHYTAFDAPLGGAPECEIVPVRVACSVVQILTSGIARGIAYAAELCQSSATRVHVLSMSMGGVASKAWADAVNEAYEKGIVLVTAAGNNYSAGLFGFPTHFVVFPARFRRVIAACGVMSDRRPYYGLPLGKMQGNWGPASKMDTALSAFTPNMPWAEIGSPAIVDMSGGGTSAATPQVAAAAALYLQTHATTLLDDTRYRDPWMRVEAVRQALFSTADRTADGGRPDRLGRGIVQAARALQSAPAPAAALRKTPPDDARFAFLRVLFGTGLAASPRDEMLALEATQLTHQARRPNEPSPFEEAIPDPDLPAAEISPERVRRFLEAILDHPDASPELLERAERARRELGGTPIPGGGPTSPGGTETAPPEPEVPPEPVKGGSADRPSISPDPPYRRLRGFAIDPGLATSLATAAYSEICLKVPWESLAPGPVGEYLEVIDVDPASDCYYDPVNLDDPRLLAQDGLAPSEGTPQFHQQMAYAVASLTVRNFERALGRRVLWRPKADPRAHSPKDDSVYVPRLRVYPHAMREQNAYYSPDRIALLFGYFNQTSEVDGDTRLGPMVFSCLSHDIVAHETTHALLDGMHRRYLEPSNPDVLAFHEAFADLVALLQHFTFPEILREAISSTRGEVRTRESLLGELAGQFARATGQGHALRSAIGTWKDGVWVPATPDPGDYERLTEPHDRGGILVAAVFDAFLAIYERRTADLLRLATGGSGVLRPGAIHPDLVARLAAEAAKSAQHVLTMCIRALDYLPPADVTFGEYLRALVTADVDLVPDDDLRYRVAFLEAFRRRGIQPRDVRTLSIESLLWRGQESDTIRPSKTLLEGFGLLRRYADDYARTEALDLHERRHRLFLLQGAARLAMHEWLAEHFKNHPDGRRDALFLGLDPSGETISFEVHSLRFALRATPDGDVVPQIVMSLLQEHAKPLHASDPDAGTIPFQGGCTIVADLHRLMIRYAIRKSATSAGRLQRQREFTLGLLARAGGTYTSTMPDVGKEPFALLHLGL